MKEIYIKPETTVLHVAVENNILNYSVIDADDEGQRPIIDGDLDEGIEVGTKGDGGGIWGDDEW